MGLRVVMVGRVWAYNGSSRRLYLHLVCIYVCACVVCVGGGGVEGFSHTDKRGGRTE